jgi:MFS family permease
VAASHEEYMSNPNVGYIALLRHNRPFRRLWYGQVVSQLGDWFDSIALFALLLKLTGSGQAVGALLVAQFLPAAVVGLWAGVIVDRLPRKLVMIAANLGSAALVLLFLLVRDANQIWMIYVVTVLKMSLVSFFDPARTAVTPLITRREELIAANAISGATWSAMLAIGAALGGLVAGTLGTDAAFIIDAASFALSAALIWTVPIHEAHLHERVPARVLHEFREGLRFVFSHRDIAIYTMTKMLWSLGGGVLLLLTLFGRRVFPLGVEGALSIGLLYAARGIGAGIGPIIARHLGGDGERFLRRAIGPAFFFSAVGYMIVSGAPALLLAALGVVIAHVGGSIEWVFSTALLQMRAPNRLQGRVFAVDGALLTLASALSSFVTGVASDAGWQPRALALALAGVFVVPGAVLALLLWPAPEPRPEGVESIVALEPIGSRKENSCESP